MDSICLNLLVLTEPFYGGRPPTEQCHRRDPPDFYWAEDFAGTALDDE
jgi:hypothetical protein